MSCSVVNSRWTDAAGGQVALALLAVFVLACGGDSSSKKKATKPPADPVQADAEELGHELFDTIDRIMSYRSAHQNQLPNSLRQAGIDSLSSTTVRRYARTGGTPAVTVAYRRPAEHQVNSCQGTSDILEDASLHEGAFNITCILSNRSSRSFSVGHPPAE